MYSYDDCVVISNQDMAMFQYNQRMNPEAKQHGTGRGLARNNDYVTERLNV